MLGVHYREELDEPVARELDAITSTLRAFLYTEHNEDGTHRDTETEVLTETHGHLWNRGPWAVSEEAYVRPADIASGSYNNYAPPGIGSAVLLELEPVSGTVTLTGIQAPTTLQRRFLYLRNRDSSATVALSHESSSSLEANRFDIPGGLNLGPNTAVLLHYDTGRKRWTSVTAQRLNSGTYTPTLTKVANLTGTPQAFTCQWSRVGDVVTVSGRFSAEPTASGALTQLGMSLPVASGISTAEQIGGTAVGIRSTPNTETASIEGDATNDRALLKWVAAATSDHDFFFSFTYLVV